MAHCCILFLVIVAITAVSHAAASVDRLTKLSKLAKSHGSLMDACLHDKELFEHAFEGLIDWDRLNLFYVAFIAKQGTVHLEFDAEEIIVLARQLSDIGLQTLTRFVRRNPNGLAPLQRFYQRHPDLLPSATLYAGAVAKMWLTCEACFRKDIAGKSHYQRFKMVKEWSGKAGVALYRQHVTEKMSRLYFIKNFLLAILIEDEKLDDDFVSIWFGLLNQWNQKSELDEMANNMDNVGKIKALVLTLSQFHDLTVHEVRLIKSIFWTSKYRTVNFIQLAIELEAFHIVRVFLQSMSLKVVYGHTWKMSTELLDQCIPVMDFETEEQLYRTSIYHPFRPSKTLEKFLESSFELDRNISNNIDRCIPINELPNDIIVKIIRLVCEDVGGWFLRSSLKMVCIKWNHLLSWKNILAGPHYSRLHTDFVLQQLRLSKFGKGMSDSTKMLIQSIFENLSEEELQKFKHLDLIMGELVASREQIISHSAYARLLHAHSKGQAAMDLVIPSYYSGNERAEIFRLLHYRYDCVEKFSVAAAKLLSIIESIFKHNSDMEEAKVLATRALGIGSNIEQAKRLVLLRHYYDASYSKALVEFLFDNAVTEDTIIQMSQNDHLSLARLDILCFHRLLIDLILKGDLSFNIDKWVVGVLKEVILNKGYSLEDASTVIQYFHTHHPQVDLEAMWRAMLKDIGHF